MVIEVGERAVYILLESFLVFRPNQPSMKFFKIKYKNQAEKLIAW